MYRIDIFLISKKNNNKQTYVLGITGALPIGAHNICFHGEISLFFLAEKVPYQELHVFKNSPSKPSHKKYPKWYFGSTK